MRSPSFFRTPDAQATDPSLVTDLDLATELGLNKLQVGCHGDMPTHAPTHTIFDDERKTDSFGGCTAAAEPLGGS